ncbi:MAG: signal recognition particle-docking protein FtsY [Desulfovibrio sp.]|uniref:signal recognition particle-docking protein FtsY n=1 Tax=Desulfovibrio sp. TaxID=885 RepID=UPI002A828675|nr:signal recognition particle-docking protein FtsY [Desulfovibrio sp.]MDY4806269.1 signal recognition particle-docking protein FtsY [Desulfovibrio sp.]
MGFFSAVKKFFGGGTEETKETQAAAVEKEAAATSVAPEEPAADTGSAVAGPESTPEPESVPAAEEVVAPAEDASADEAPEDEAAPVAGDVEQVAPEAEAVVADEPAVEVPAAESDGPVAGGAEEGGSVEVAVTVEPADQPAASGAPAEAESTVAEGEAVAEAEGSTLLDEPTVEVESEPVAEAEEAPAAVAEDEFPSAEEPATEADAETVAPEEASGDAAGEAGTPAEQDDVSSEAIAPEVEAAEAEVVEICEEPAGADAAPVDAVEEALSDMEETRPETEAVAADPETVVETAQEAEEEPLPEDVTGADAVETADAAGDDTTTVSPVEAGTDVVEEDAARDEVREEAEEKSEAAAPRRSWWQRIFGSDEDTVRPEAAVPAGEAEETPVAVEQEAGEDVHSEAAVAEADTDERVAAEAESTEQEPLAEVEENTGSAAATPEQNEPVAEVVADAALAATAAAAAAATAERPTAPALETCGLDPALAQSMILRLREAEPRLSVWLGIVLEGVEEAGDELWKRLRFLLRSLDAPAAEVDAFVDDFRGWLERMEYVQLDEFRSELQYRLTLALDMEDEEDERSRLFLKISEGLSRTREQFSRRLDSLFSSHGELNESFWEELEELFIMADLGYEPSLELVERLRERARKENVTRVEDVRGLLMAEVDEIFRLPRRISAVNPPEVVLFIGVNGVGKTTTIAKLAHRARMQGKKVMIAAADTFRAAAIEQLQVWAERVGALFHARPAGSDPASVAYEAMDRALAEKVDILFVDTAGRLQTKVNLMEELTKIRQVLGKKHEGAPHRCILVIDATTGQNALSQAKLFKEAAGVDELILTKLDGTAKGGVAIAVAMQEKLPITYVGLGEKLEDLRPFNGADYARALLGDLDQGK